MGFLNIANIVHLMPPFSKREWPTGPYGLRRHKPANQAPRILGTRAYRLFDKKFLVAGKSIRREKHPVKENNWAKGNGKHGGQKGKGRVVGESGGLDAVAGQDGVGRRVPVPIAVRS